MAQQNQGAVTHPAGEQPPVEERPATADTFAGRVHVEWDATAPVTPFGQLPFFIDFLKQANLFDPWVADCPLYLISPNAPRKRDLLGTVMLSVLAGHRRYAHVTALRCDPVNPPLLGMRKVVSEDLVRRNLEKIAGEPGRIWIQNHLDYCTAPLLGTRKAPTSHTTRANLAVLPTAITHSSWRTCVWCCVSMCVPAMNTT